MHWYEAKDAALPAPGSEKTAPRLPRTRKRQATALSKTNSPVFLAPVGRGSIQAPAGATLFRPLQTVGASPAQLPGAQAAGPG